MKPVVIHSYDIAVTLKKCADRLGSKTQIICSDHFGNIDCCDSSNLPEGSIPLMGLDFSYITDHVGDLETEALAYRIEKKRGIKIDFQGKTYNKSLKNKSEKVALYWAPVHYPAELTG